MGQRSKFKQWQHFLKKVYNDLCMLEYGSFASVTEQLPAISGVGPAFTQKHNHGPVARQAVCTVLPDVIVGWVMWYTVPLEAIL